MLALDIMNALSGVAPTRAAGTAAPAGTEAPTKRDVPADAIPRSEAIVRDYLARKGADPVVRSFYASVLSSEERLPEAAEQLRMATKERPKLAQLWIALGDAELELHHPAVHDLLVEPEDQVREEDADQLAPPQPREPRAEPGRKEDDACTFRRCQGSARGFERHDSIACPRDESGGGRSLVADSTRSSG